MKGRNTPVLWPLYGTCLAALGFAVVVILLRLFRPPCGRDLLLLCYGIALVTGGLFYGVFWRSITQGRRSFPLALAREIFRATALLFSLFLAYQVTFRLIFRFEAWILPHAICALIFGGILGFLLSTTFLFAYFLHRSLCLLSQFASQKRSLALLMGPLLYCPSSENTLAYPELHYDPLPGLSRLKIPFPEILADAPRVVRSSSTIPLLCLVKDAHLYPIQLEEIHIHLSTTSPSHFEGKDLLLVKAIHASVSERYWYQIYEIPLPLEKAEEVELDVTFLFRREGSLHRVNNDNFPQMSHAPLKVQLSQELFPGMEGWLYGDGHAHSWYSDNQVEFGAPLDVLRRMAEAVGLDWVACVDHSFDLDDAMEDTMKDDLSFPRWHQYLKEIQELNALGPEVLLIPGEELSCRNAFGFDVHMILLGNTELWPGGSDACERFPWDIAPHTVKEVLDLLPNSVAAFAAHPHTGRSYNQALFISRTNWLQRDYEHPRLHGLQLWNGRVPYKDTHELWSKLLLKGSRLTVLAGSDAHGDFNSKKGIRTPFFSTYDDSSKYLGVARTAVRVGEDRTPEAIVSAIRQGRSVATSGPFLFLAGQDTQGREWHVGDEASSPVQRYCLTALSNSEFGPLQEIRIFMGRPGESQEQTIVLHPDPSSEPYTMIRIGEIQPPLTTGYLRGEATTRSSFFNGLCITNPIWVNAGRPRQTEP